VVRVVKDDPYLQAEIEVYRIAHRQRMLEKALQVQEEALDAGDVKVAQQVLTRNADVLGWGNKGDKGGQVYPEDVMMYLEARGMTPQMLHQRMIDTVREQIAEDKKRELASKAGGSG
jgi:hypothetical protein